MAKKKADFTGAKYTDLLKADDERDCGFSPDNISIPYGEYAHLDIFMGNFMAVLRTSMGDFDFSAADYLTPNENVLFWCIWFAIVLMTCIIFLNFIIAEASASYEKVKERLEAYIFKAKANMVAEVELMYFDDFPCGICTRTNEKMPKFLVIRKIDT